MTTAQFVKTSVTVNNSPIQDYVHSDDHAQPTYEIAPGLKHVTVLNYSSVFLYPLDHRSVDHICILFFLLVVKLSTFRQGLTKSIQFVQSSGRFILFS